MIILVLTLLPGSYISQVDFIKITNFDKFVHFLLFLVFAILFFISIAAVLFPGNAKYLPWIATAIISIGFGILIEFFQKYIPGRDPDILDVLADALGALFGIVLVIVEKNLHENKN